MLERSFSGAARGLVVLGVFGTALLESKSGLSAPLGAALSSELQVGIRDEVTEDHGEEDPPITSNEAPILVPRFAAEPTLSFGVFTMGLGLEYGHPIAIESDWFSRLGIRARFSVEVGDVDDVPLRLEAIVATSPFHPPAYIRAAAGASFLVVDSLEVFCHGIYHDSALVMGGQAELDLSIRSYAVAVGTRVVID